MVRAPFFDKNGLKKGAWSKEEDEKLRAYIQRYGHWNWRELPKFAGLSRCGKSCRLRWMNYLRPDLKHGNYSKEEEDLIMKLHEQLGNKWSIIATNLPGRTDNEIKNYWHTHLKKRMKQNQNTSELKEQPSEQISETSQSEVTENREMEAESVIADIPSHPILESSLLSPLSNDSTPVVGPGTNWIVEDSPTSFGISEASIGDFWTVPFAVDNAYSYNQGYPFSSQEGGFISPYVSYYDDSMDLLYQVLQELPRN